MCTIKLSHLDAIYFAYLSLSHSLHIAVKPLQLVGSTQFLTEPCHPPKDWVYVANCPLYAIVQWWEYSQMTTQRSVGYGMIWSPSISLLHMQGQVGIDFHGSPPIPWKQPRRVSPRPQSSVDWSCCREREPIPQWGGVGVELLARQGEHVKAHIKNQCTVPASSLSLLEK